MDDELTFGASVWGAAEPLTLSPPAASTSEPSPAPSSSTQDGFDDFEEFGTPAETLAASGDENDDDFGDFGDFGEVATLDEGATFGSQSFEAEEVLTPRPEEWEALHLEPMPTTQDIKKQINAILGPLWTSKDSAYFTDDPIRQAEGLNQTLVTPERYFFTYAIRNSYLKSQIVPVGNCMIYCFRLPSRRSNPSTGRVRAYDDNIS